MQNDQRVCRAVFFDVDEVAQNIFRQMHAIDKCHLDGTAKYRNRVMLCEERITRCLEEIRLRLPFPVLPVHLEVGIDCNGLLPGELQ